MTGNPSDAGDNSGTMTLPNCPAASCQNGTMQCANLARPIPENNYREYTEKTTTTTDSDVSDSKDATESEEMRLLLLSVPLYGLQEKTVRKFVRDFGEELVRKEFALLKKLVEQKKPIQNPAGWLRCALEQEYVDTRADYEKIQAQKKAEAEAKNRARQEFYERQDREERKKQAVQIDSSSPFYEFLQRHCVIKGVTAT